MTGAALNMVRFVGPGLCLLAIFGVRVFAPEHRFESIIMGELGFVELGTAVILIVALPFAVRAIGRTNGLARAWLVALTLGAVYFAGEELSWGQHLVGWGTPEAIAELNDQNETNLHNMSSWLDQKPRLGLELWVLMVACAGWVSALRRRAWLFGRGELQVLAWATIVVRLPERVSDWSGTTLPPALNFRLAEVQEMMFAWIFLAWFVLALVTTASGHQVNTGDPQLTSAD